MRQQMFDDGDIQIFREGVKYFVRYDAGSHQIEMREDEVSVDEVNRMMGSPGEVNNVLLSLQKRLQEAGENPYKSNI
jgi:hypothetical protein